MTTCEKSLGIEQYKDDGGNTWYHVCAIKNTKDDCGLLSLEDVLYSVKKQMKT